MVEMVRISTSIAREFPERRIYTGTKEKIFTILCILSKPLPVGAGSNPISADIDAEVNDDQGKS